MTYEEILGIRPMSNIEIENFKNADDHEVSDDMNLEDLKSKLVREERRIISLMKRIVLDVIKYNDYGPMKEFVAAIKTSQYLNTEEYKEYIQNEGRRLERDNLKLHRFLVNIEKVFDDRYIEGFL